MRIATIAIDHGFPPKELLFIVLCIMMATAFCRGLRGWDEGRENTPWLRHAWGNGSGIWILIFTVALLLLAPSLIPRRIIPYFSADVEPLFFLVALVITSLLCAIFSRLLGVWMGFRWRQALG